MYLSLEQHRNASRRVFGGVEENAPSRSARQNYQRAARACIPGVQSILRKLAA